MVVQRTRDRKVSGSSSGYWFRLSSISLDFFQAVVLSRVVGVHPKFCHSAVWIISPHGLLVHSEVAAPIFDYVT